MKKLFREVRPAGPGTPRVPDEARALALKLIGEAYTAFSLACLRLRA